MTTTPNQLLEQSTRHAAHLERLKTQDVQELRDLFQQMQDQLVGWLSQEDVQSWTRSQLQRRLNYARGLLREGFDDGIVPALNRQIRELGEYEAGFEARNLNEVALNYDPDVPGAEQILEAIRGNPLNARGPDGGKLLTAFVQDWSEREVQRGANAIRLGFAQGEPTRDVVSRLVDEGLPASRRALDGVARTALQHSAAQARAATWDANGDLVRGVRIVATLDSRTSTICQSLDGRVFDRGEGPRPPFHVNCRTTTAAALDERFSLLEEGGTRRARNPQTGNVTDASAETTYYGWLKKQPASVQDSIIGPTRGKLLREGGIDAERFAELQLGRNFEPATLEQMRELEPAAFERAGLTDDDA